MKKTRLIVTILFGAGLGFLTWYALSKGMDAVAGNGMTGVYLLGISYSASQGFTKGQYLKSFSKTGNTQLEG